MCVPCYNFTVDGRGGYPSLSSPFFHYVPLVSEGSKGEFICFDAKSFVVNRLGDDGPWFIRILSVGIEVLSVRHVEFDEP